MLAKQAWRILKNPEDLSLRILKAVYYPNTELLEATLGSSPSQVWRALTEGRDVLKQGIIRRIGTGRRTTLGTITGYHAISCFARWYVRRRIHRCRWWLSLIT
jgi:hypothetical protein